MLPEDSCMTNKQLKDGAGGGRTGTTFSSVPTEGSAHCGKQMSSGAQSNSLERQNPGPGTCTGDTAQRR